MDRRSWPPAARAEVHNATCLNWPSSGFLRWCPANPRRASCRPRRARGGRSRMMLRVSVQEPPDHALILRVVPSRFGLEEIHAAFAQRDGDLDPLVPEDEILRAREKGRNDPWVSERFVRVPDFPAHISACLSASSRRQKSE